MKISARNYATQAENGLAKYKRENPITYLAEMCNPLVEKIRRSQHFAIPDGGIIFDDDYRGIDPISVRLPYPCITIASCMKGTYSAPSDEHTTDVDKVLVIAEETESFEVGGVEFGAGILVYSVNHRNGWFPNWSVGFKPRSSTDAREALTYPATNKIHDAMMKLAIEKHGPLLAPKMIQQDASQDSGMDLRFVLELVEALACKNVTSEPFENIKAKASHKRKKGKATLYETKRLVLVRPGSADSSSGTGNGKSPRAHLRRGHIRRIESGNIWISATAVGDIKNGFLNKDYDVTS